MAQNYETLKTWPQRAGYSPTEFVQMCGLSKPYVYKLIEAGKIKAVRIGPRRLLIPVGEVERLLQHGTEG